MQSHENMEIYQKAFDIIERYFGTEEEDKDVSLCSIVARDHFPLCRLFLQPTPISSLSAAEAETASSLSKALISRFDETLLYFW